METINKIFAEYGFNPARLICGSKSSYRERYPDNDVLFNANIFCESLGEKVWYGDLDITLDAKNLQNVSNRLNDILYIIPEMYGRFGAENRDFKEIIEDAHTYFVPNSEVYYKRIYSGLEVKEIDNITFIKNKPVDWKEVKINDG